MNEVISAGTVGAAFSEKRRSLRVRADLWVDELHRGALTRRRATELSLSGAWLEGMAQRQHGERVELTFRLFDDDGALRVAAEVVGHSHERGTAMRFIDVSRGQRVRLANYILAGC